MKPIFYYFGIKRISKLFGINDPLAIVDEFMPTTLRDSLKDKKEFDEFKPLLEELNENRGILFGFSEESKKSTKFLKLGQIISPDLTYQNTSIYFLDNLIIFKINQDLMDFSKINELSWKILEPYNLLTKEQFDSESPKNTDPQEYPYNLVLRQKNLNLAIRKLYQSIFICINSKDHNNLKTKIGKLINELNEKDQHVTRTKP